MRDAVIDGPLPTPSEAALTQARALAPGMDVYALVADWQDYWARSGKRKLRAVDAAFLGFVKRSTQAGID